LTNPAQPPLKIESFGGGVWTYSWEEKVVAPLIAAPNGEMRK
jgi:hypothetical protein